MIDSFTVGATLELKSNVEQTLGAIAREFESFDERVQGSRRVLGEFRATLDALAGGSRRIGGLARSLEKIGSVRIGGSAESVEIMAKALAALSDDGAGLGRLTSALGRLAKADLGAKVEGIDAFAGAVRGLTKEEPALSRMAAAMQALGRIRPQIFKDAALASQVSPEAAAAELAARQKEREERAKARQEADARHRDRALDHDLGMTGLALGTAGGAVDSVMTRALERSFQMEHLRTQILADRRVTPAQADQAVEAAYAATKAAPGTTPIANLRSIIDLKNVTGSLSEAETMLPQFARLTALLEMMDRRKGGSGDPAYAAAKAMEIMGQMIEERRNPQTGQMERVLDPDLLNKHLEMMTRVAIATNMRVPPQEYLLFAKQARAAGMMLSDKFIYQFLPALLQTTGGRRIGTALMSTFQVFDGNMMRAKTYDALADIGLAKPGVRIRKKYRTANGHIRERDFVDSSGVYDLSLLLSDPVAYIEAAEKRMSAHGIKGVQAQIEALMKASQRSTIAGLLADLLKDLPAIKKEQQNIVNTRPDVFEHFAQNDPLAKMQQFEAALDKFLTVLGGVLMDPAIKMLDAMTAALNAISDWARKNPNMAAILAETAGGLGVLATAIGALSVALWMYMPVFKLAKLLAAGGGGAVGEAAGGAGIIAGTMGMISRFTPWAPALWEMAPSPTNKGEDAFMRNFHAASPEQQKAMIYGSSGQSMAPPPPPLQGRNDNHEPVPVKVVNGHDLANGVGQHITKQMKRTPTGYTGPDPRIDLGGADSGWSN